MEKRTRRKKIEKMYMSIIRLVLSIIIIIGSIFVLYRIYDTIINYQFLEGIRIKEDNMSDVVFVDNNSSNNLFINDDKGLRYKKSDGTFAKDEWIEKNGELFYFDTSMYGKNGDMRIDGQIFTFNKGKLVKIDKDNYYINNSKDEYFNSVDSTQYFVYLDDENDLNGAYPVVYKKYSDNSTDYLGTKDDMQYCSTNMLKVSVNLIYYLGIAKGYEYSGKLCRMRPNAESKEVIGENVKGYVILSNDVVYIYDNGIIKKAKNWERVSVKYINEENLFEDALNAVPVEESTIDSGRIRIIEDGPLANVKEETTTSKNEIVINEKPISTTAKPVNAPVEPIKIGPLGEIVETTKSKPAPKEEVPLPLPLP